MEGGGGDQAVDKREMARERGGERVESGGLGGPEHAPAQALAARQHVPREAAAQRGGEPNQLLHQLRFRTRA